MCELFGLSASHPVGVRFSFEEFARHGGGTGPHADGWGVAFYSGCDVRWVREPEPASTSACARLIGEQNWSSRLVISHIRRTTQGARELANTHPFVRLFAGRAHVFAHNGDLVGFRFQPMRHSPCARWLLPIGQTDSEAAFCALLAELSNETDGDTGEQGLPPLERRIGVVREFARSAARYGPANFLYCDGDALFAFSHWRRVTGPTVGGLHMLCHRCQGKPPDLEAADLALWAQEEQEESSWVVFASVPLTAAAWEELPVGTMVVVREGQVVLPTAVGD